MMVNLHFSFSFHKSLLEFFPKSEKEWLPSNYCFPDVLITDQLAKKETISALLSSNDFPVLQAPQIADTVVGMVMERKRPDKISFEKKPLEMW